MLQPRELDRGWEVPAAACRAPPMRGCGFSIRDRPEIIELLRNYEHGIAAIDFFVVPAVAFRLPYVCGSSLSMLGDAA